MRQLTSLDAQFLAMETGRTYGHVGALALFDPSAAPGGAVSADDLARVVAGRIDQLPPFHQRLVEVPFGLDHPYWIEDPDFDLGFHIRDTAVPPPGDDRRLADTVARIFARPLDRKRPLWELYLIHGIAGGRVGMLTKVHHAAVDGVSGAEILGVLFDLEPGAPAAEDKGASWEPERLPSDLEMLGRGLLGLPRQPVRALRSLPAALPALPNFPGAALVPGMPLLQRARSGAQKALGTAHDTELVDVRVSRAPKTRFNGKVSPHRRFSFGSLSLDDVKALKDELGIKVNDVVVALCATAVRNWLLARGELPDEPLVALVPVSVRTDQERGTFGNKLTGMILPIPTDVEDPRARLLRAHEVLKRAKGQTQGLPASLMTDVSNFLPPAIFNRAARLALEVSGRVRPALNLIISNVPGPPVPLYCAGARLLAHHPVSVVMDGVGLNITVMSYEDRLDFGIVVDPDMVDDAWSFMDAMRQALDELVEAILGRERAPEPAPA
ncbi:MAG: WS/DGAT/MGAT family O-acyltransferase [Solirubrobacteraceae bacterium]